MLSLSVSRDLDELRTQARKQVSDAAEELRLLYITPGSGKAMVYREKAKEAQAVLDHLTPSSLNAADFPMLASEMAIHGGDLEDAAATIGARADQWRGIAQIIETLEGVAKRDIDVSSSPTEIETLATSVTVAALTAVIASQT